MYEARSLGEHGVHGGGQNAAAVGMDSLHMPRVQSLPALPPLLAQPDAQTPQSSGANHIKLGTHPLHGKQAAHDLSRPAGQVVVDDGVAPTSSGGENGRQTLSIA